MNGPLSDLAARYIAAYDELHRQGHGPHVPRQLIAAACELDDAEEELACAELVARGHMRRQTRDQVCRANDPLRDEREPKAEAPPSSMVVNAPIYGAIFNQNSPHSNNAVHVNVVTGLAEFEQELRRRRSELGLSVDDAEGLDSQLDALAEAASEAAAKPRLVRGILSSIRSILKRATNAGLAGTLLGKLSEIAGRIS